MSTYSILNAGRIVAGPDSIEQIADIVKDYGASRVLIISDKGVARAGLIDRPKALLEAAGRLGPPLRSTVILDDTPPEPEVEQANAIVTAAKNSGCDMVVGIGGGSAMDVAKLTAVLLNNDVTLRELLDKAPIPRRGLPTLMIPTTAGTGYD